MKTAKTFIRNQDGNPVTTSKALIWGNNAAWLCTECGELLGNRTGDTEYRVECTNRDCTAIYEIEWTKNKSGMVHLGAAAGIRKIR